MKPLLIALGAVLIVLSLLPFALVWEFLAHPGGIGMEWIAVPVVAAVGAGLLGLGIVLIRIARAVKRGPPTR